MKLWLDGQCLQTSSRNRGIGRYASDLIWAISERHPKVELHISFNAQLPSEAIAAREFVSQFIQPKNMHVWNGVSEAGESITGFTHARHLSEVALTHHVNCLAPDVALSLSPFEGQSDLAVPLLPSKELRVPCAGIFYDAIPWRYKNFYLSEGFRTQYYERRLKSCAEFEKLLCISEFSTQEAIDLLPGVSAANISAGVSKDFLSPAGGRKRVDLGFDNPFVLYVGGLDWRKNVRLIPEAFARMHKQSQEKYCFVVAGDSPSQLINELSKVWNSSGLNAKNFKYVGYVSEGELLDLYERAALVVQPSLMEGFGLTALEALYCRTPILVANAGAMSEVVTSEQFRFDPNSPGELAARMNFVLGNNSLASKYHQLRTAAITQFTWAKSAERAVTELEKIAGQKLPKGLSIAELRKITAPSLIGNSIEQETIARTMAVAELKEHRSGRLVIDVSNVITSPAETGIQRVVRRICEEMKTSLHNSNWTPTFAYCLDKDVWHSSASATRHEEQHLRGSPLPPFQGYDKLLLLDSSWHLIDLHYNGIREARLRGADVIVSIFDFIPLTHSAFCVQGTVTSYHKCFLTMLQLATGFVCISKAVADQFLQILQMIDYPRPMKVGYWRLGADMDRTANNNLNAKTKGKLAATKQKNFLMVGTLEPRKGYNIALKAFETLWSQGENSTLTIVGKQGWKTEQLAKRIMNHKEFGSRLFWKNAADDRELAELYANTDGLICASYAEGFGLPIIEAGYYRKRVIASDIPVFREAAKGAVNAQFFKVGSAQDLAKQVAGFSAQSRAANQTKKSGIMKWPTWEQSARELAKVVLQDKWYKIYEPKANQKFLPISNIGVTRNLRAYMDLERRRELKFVGFLEAAKNERNTEILVEVTNLSKVAWFGVGNGQNGIGLGYHAYGASGKLLNYDNPRTRIPLGIAPGQTHYMAVSVPVRKGCLRVAHVMLELVQEGVDWWGPGLRVDLPNTH